MDAIASLSKVPDEFELREHFPVASKEDVLIAVRKIQEHRHLCFPRPSAYTGKRKTMAVKFLSSLESTHTNKLQKWLRAFTPGVLQGIKELRFNNPILRVLPRMFSVVSKLEMLNFMGSFSLQKIPNISPLTNLRILNFSFCKKLQKIPEGLEHTQIESLMLERCESLVDVDCLQKVKTLRNLFLGNCTSLKRLPRLDMPNLVYLDLIGCLCVPEKFRVTTRTHEATQSRIKTLNLIFEDSKMTAPKKRSRTKGAEAGSVPVKRKKRVFFDESKNTMQIFQKQEVSK